MDFPMDTNPPSSSVPPKVLMFKPKATRRRPPKPRLPKTEQVAGDKEAAQAQSLLRRFNENVKRPKLKVENNSLGQVAFGIEANSSTSIRPYNIPNGHSKGLNNSSNNGNELILASTVEPDQTVASSASALKKGEYREPWDYNHTYYPICLPLRPPYSGDPECLNEVEFREEAATSEYDDSTVNPALELGLQDASEDTKLLSLQLPPTLPLVKRWASAKGKEIAGSSMSSNRIGFSGKACEMEELQGGYMGKMLVYKSGAVKMKLGDVLYDVSPGTDSVFAQDLVAINTKEKHCCNIGELHKKGMVTPDINFLLDNVINLD